MAMMVLALVSWWYTAGWSAQAHRVGRRVDAVLEGFSVTMLMGSLFEPFRQISADVQGRGIDAQLRALGDRVFSRAIGAAARTIIILVGVLCALVTAVAGVVQLITWPLLPVTPLVGIVLALTGLGA